MAIKIEKRINIDRDFILESITEYDIYRYYYREFTGDVFELNVDCLSPFKPENKPSFKIGMGPSGDRIIHRSFNSDHRGDCFKFVMELFDINFHEALMKISMDFGLINGTEGYKAIKKLYKAPELKVRIPKFLQAEARKWTKEDDEWWNQFHLNRKDLNFCDDTSVYATKKWAIDGQKQLLKYKELSYFYHLTNIRGSWIKIYRPQADTKEDKWHTSIPHREMHGLSNLDGCEIGFIQKSMKDGAFTHKFLCRNVAVSSNEAATSISIENRARINQSCRKVYIIFDGDQTGVEAANLLAEETGWIVANPPSHLLTYGITDLTDWAKATSPGTVIDYYKNLQII